MSLLKIWLSVYLFDIYDIVSALPYNFMENPNCYRNFIVHDRKRTAFEEKLQYKECVVHGTHPG